MFLFSSAWIPKENVFDYIQFKNRFLNKNHTKSFQRAIKEIENELYHQTNDEITLKNVSMNSILKTFDENIALLKPIFESRVNVPNRFNVGNGMDYLTILYRTVTSEQQQQMYIKIVQQFTKDERKYFDSPTVNFQTNFFFKLFRN